MKASERAYALLILLFIISFSYWLAGAASLYDSLRFGQERARLPLLFGFRLQIITSALPEARNAGAHYGDTLLEVNGRPFTGYRVLRDAVLDARPGTLMHAVIQRPDGTVAPVDIKLAPERLEPAPISEWLRDISLELVFPLFCLFLGFWVAAVRPLDRNAWLLLAIMISLEFLTPEGSFTEPWQILRVSWDALAGFSWPLWMMFFGIYFPERSALDRRFPWATRIVVLVLIISTAPILVYEVGREVGFAAVAWIRPMLFPMDLVRQVFAMAAISLFFANLGAKSGTASTKDVARRIRFVWLGAAVGLTPMFVVGLNSLLGGGDIGAGLPVWFLYLAIGCLAIFPLTLAYVILVQRAMDVRVAIRQSVRYTLFRGGLWLVGALMFTVAMKIFVDVSQDKRSALLPIRSRCWRLVRCYCFSAAVTDRESSGGSTGASSVKLTAPNSC